MKKILAIFVTLITFGTTYAQTFQLKSEGRDQNYVNSILGRAQKVTDALNITGTDKGEQVRNIVANRYFTLNDIYAERDSIKKSASTLTGNEKSSHRNLQRARKIRNFIALTQVSLPTCLCFLTIIRLKQ